MTRILHIINRLYGAAGAERQLMLNLAALDRCRFENYICCIGEPGDLAADASNLGIPVFSLGAAGKPQWPGAVARMCKLIRSLKVELVHTSLFDADIIGGIAGRLCGVPVVSTLCSMGGDPERLIDDPHLNRFKLAVTTKLWGLCLRFFHRHSVAVSNAVKESAARTYGVPGNDMTIIYRAVSKEWLSNGSTGQPDRLRWDLNLGDAYPVLMNVARLVPQKGQRYLIQAMPSVVARFPRAHLLIVGDGPLREPLTGLCHELRVNDHVTLLGRRNDVKELLSISDIFTSSSLSEGCPNALLEAMAMSRPCVASRIGPTEEIIEHGTTGMLVPPRSPADLAEAIICLGTQPDLAQDMGRRARQVVEERFTIDRTIKQLEELYDRVLDGKKGIPWNGNNRGSTDAKVKQ